MSLADPSLLDSFLPDGQNIVQASYSSITLHRKCPQAWYYRHGLRLEKDETPSPYLIMGRWWSALRAAEALNRGRLQGTLLELPRDLRDKAEGYDFLPSEVVVDDVIRASETRWKGLSADERDLFISTLGAALPDRLRGMYAIWDADHQERFDREQPLGVEMFWKRALPRPKDDAAWSLLAEPERVPAMHLIGFVDYAYFDRARGMTVIQDDKAPSSMSNSTSSLDDLMDSQLQLYAWGIAPKITELGGKAPRAVAYDRTCSVAPKTPQLTLTGTLSKSITAYDLQTYLSWAKADGRPEPEEIAQIERERGMVEGGLVRMIEKMSPGPFWGKLGDVYASGAKKGLPKFGTYELDPKMVEKLSAPDERYRWHRRTVKPISTPTVRAHLRSAVDTALDIYQTQQRANATGEGARNLDRFGCGRCDYQDLCRAQLLSGARGDYELESFNLRQRPPRREQ